MAVAGGEFGPSPSAVGPLPPTSLDSELHPPHPSATPSPAPQAPTPARPHPATPKPAAKAAGAKATKLHPFVDKADLSTVITGPFSLFGPSGDLVCTVVRGGYTQRVADLAADVLRDAPTTGNMRAAIYGGTAPLTGIAGYYDYTGTPLTFKCRKTSFTHANLERWPNVFPLVEYINNIYHAAAPRQWVAQNKAIPNPIRIRRSVFSTITVNQRFRTAAHTDVGDYDRGMGVLTILEGTYEGLHLALPDFDLCIELKPLDVLVFDTHYLHCNTEPETADWDRLSCVFYYRVRLGEDFCWAEYLRRKAEHDQNSGLTLSQRPRVEPNKNLRKHHAGDPPTILSLISGLATAQPEDGHHWVHWLQANLQQDPHRGHYLFEEWPGSRGGHGDRFAALRSKRRGTAYEPVNLQHPHKALRELKRARAPDSADGDSQLVHRFLEVPVPPALSPCPGHLYTPSTHCRNP